MFQKTTTSAVLLCAALSVYGWIADIGFLKSPFQEHGVIGSNTFILILLVSLGSLALTKNTQFGSWIARAIGFLFFAFGVLVSVDSLLSIGLELDFTVFEPSPDSVPITFPGPVAFYEAPSYLLMGIALMLISLRSTVLIAVGRACAIFAAIPYVSAIAGHSADVPHLFTFCVPTECARVSLVEAILQFSVILSIFFARFKFTRPIECNWKSRMKSCLKELRTFTNKFRIRYCENQYKLQICYKLSQPAKIFSSKSLIITHIRSYSF